MHLIIQKHLPADIHFIIVHDILRIFSGPIVFDVFDKCSTFFIEFTDGRIDIDLVLDFSLKVAQYFYK